MLLLTVNPVISRAHRCFIFVVMLSVLSLPTFAEPSADAVRLSDAIEIVNKLLFRLKSVLRAKKSRYILLNAPNEKINDNDRSNIDNSTSGQLDFIKKFRQ